MSFTVVAFAATISQQDHNFQGEQQMHLMALNHFGYVRNQQPVQKYVRQDAVHFKCLTCQNGHALYGIQQFAVQLLYSNLQYKPRLLVKQYLHLPRQHSHSLLQLHQVFC